jgi:hypothetical protein
MLALSSLIALGENDGIAGANRVAVPDTVIRTLVQDAPAEEQTKLLSNTAAFVGYSIDLNEDGQLELIVLAKNTYYCGSGGCNPWIIQKENGSYKQLLEAFGRPFISQSKTQGYFDFVALSNSGAFREGGAVYQWQGSAYERRDCFVTLIDSKTGARTSRPAPCE